MGLLDCSQDMAASPRASESSEEESAATISLVTQPQKSYVITSATFHLLGIGYQVQSPCKGTGIKGAL